MATRLSLKAWIEERIENCYMMYKQVGSDEKAGWLEDASYYQETLELISASTPQAARVSVHLPCMGHPLRRSESCGNVGNGCGGHSSITFMTRCDDSGRVV